MSSDWEDESREPALINDLLDLSKAESGRGALRIERFTASDLFASMRGMLRPLLDGKVELNFDIPDALSFETDQGKLTQILRNLVTNALKFTEAGEVRVSLEQAGDIARFHVRGTGIGIAEADYETR